jgi:eukaryotic-like serine/threonine-protein kinase
MAGDARWEKVERIYNAALERPETERAAFLREACGGDEELRRDLESRLGYAQGAGEFLEPSAPEASALAAGDFVSCYRVISKLGEGGMGEVYLAGDTRLGRQVALKVLPRELAGDSRREAHFLQEARAASALDHPNIGAIYGIEETASGQRCIVMAYYEGQTLAQKMPNGPVPVPEAAAIAIQIASGLAEAHTHNIVHRDIKPSNIFLTRQGLVKIIDFGIARVIHSATSTLTANIPGTPSYMSPEQAQGKALDGRTDLWSLGTVLYEMITGRRAFAAEDAPATLFAIVHTPPGLNDDVPRPVQRIIYRALAKQTEDRYQSAAEMIQDLREVAGPDGRDSAPTIRRKELARYNRLAADPPRKQNRRQHLRWLFALLLALALGVVLMISMKLSGPKPAAYQSYLKALGYMQRPDKPENLDRAISLLQEATRADPNLALAFASLGQAYWLKSAYSNDRSLLYEAESNARRALQLNDALARVHIVMGDIQRSLGNLDLSQEELNRAIKLEPSNPDAFAGLARLYEAQDRIQEAEALYRRAAALRPDSWQGYNSLGIFLKTHNRYSEAAQQFRRVTELTPDNVAGYLNLGNALLAVGKLDDAETALNKALGCDPSSYPVHTALGALYCRKRLFRQAAQVTERALQLSHRDWRTWFSLAVIYRWLGEDGRAVAAYKSALPLLEESVRVSPRDAVLQAQLAEIYAYCGEREKSESSVRAALALAPHDPGVLMSCADAYAAMGDSGRAVELANEAVAKGFTLADLDQDPEARRFRRDPRFNASSR